jgi:hypothetical protein
MTSDEEASTDLLENPSALTLEAFYTIVHARAFGLLTVDLACGSITMPIRL